jgi:thiol-disulfide isomerase/thioredoxin
MKKNIFLLTVLFLSSCSNPRNEYVKQYLEDRPEFQVLKIKLDNSLESYSSISNDISKSIDYFNSFTVINIINTDCGSCYETMERWNEYLKNDRGLIKVVFIAIGEPNEYFKNYFSHNSSLKFYVYLDREGKFCERNDLTKYKKETFLIDKDGNIILYGDPTKSVIIEEYYKYIIYGK